MYDTTPLLAFDVGVLAIMIPIVAILTGGMIAVAPIMTKHQRHMSELVSKQHSEPGILEELQQLRRELQSMRSEINSVTIAVDDLKTSALPSASSRDINKKMEEN